MAALAAVAAKRARQRQQRAGGAEPQAAGGGAKRRRQAKSPEQLEDCAEGEEPQEDGEDSDSSSVRSVTKSEADMEPAMCVPQPRTPNACVHAYSDAVVAEARRTGDYRTPDGGAPLSGVQSVPPAPKEAGRQRSKKPQGPTHSASSRPQPVTTVEEGDEVSSDASAVEVPRGAHQAPTVEVSSDAHQPAADAGAGPATPAEPDDVEAKKGAKQRQETMALLNALGIKLDGTLKEKIQQYCRAMIEQSVDVLKKIYLPTLFSPAEMSTLWQMLKGWIAKASPKTQAKWKEICKTPMSSAGTKNLAKMAVLNIALVRQTDWEEHMVEVTIGVKDEESKKSDGKWLYKSELERKVGKATAKRWIRDGKWEEGVDSDNEPIYRKVQKSDATVRTKSSQANVKKTAGLEKEDFDALMGQMAAMFEDDAGPGRVNKRQHAKLKDGAGQSRGSAQKASEALKGDGAEPLTLALLDAPIDPESKAREVEAKSKAKKCSAKLNDKLAEVVAIKTSMGKKPTRMGALVVQEASELRVKMTQQQKILNNMAATATDKVLAADFENACAEATQMLLEVKEVKRHAKAAAPAPLREGEDLD